MSVTLAVAAFRVHQLMGDMDPDDYVVSSPKLWRRLLDKALEWGPKAGYGEAWTTGVVSLSDTGSSDFQLASGTQYSQIRSLRRASDGWLLDRRSEDEIESLRQGSPTSAGKPLLYYFIESTATRLTARFWPRPNETDTLDALVSTLPTNSAISTVTLDFSDAMNAAIIKCVAAATVRGLNAQDLAKLGIEDGKAWAANEAQEADEMFYRERLRKGHLLRARPVIASQLR